MFLHVLAPTPLTWAWQPSILVGLALLTLAYGWLVGPAGRRRARGECVATLRQLAFHSGTLLVFLALVSPLDGVADEDLFSAHMLQHMLLTYVAPPLWLLGMPAWPFEWLARRRPFGAILRRLLQPVTAFLIFNGVMWAWHLPAAYDAALENEGLHILEHLAFMGAALIGWWPAIGASLPGVNRLPDLGRSLYLFLSGLACTGLAALITLAPRPLYPFYGSRPQLWGLSPLMDQQLGGLLMWLPADLILMLFNLVILYGWLNRPPQKAELASWQPKER
jgi:cytochrome c oxidase assembly factor CtaG